MSRNSAIGIWVLVPKKLGTRHVMLQPVVDALNNPQLFKPEMQIFNGVALSSALEFEMSHNDNPIEFIEGEDFGSVYRVNPFIPKLKPEFTNITGLIKKSYGSSQFDIDIEMHNPKRACIRKDETQDDTPKQEIHEECNRKSSL